MQAPYFGDSTQRAGIWKSREEYVRSGHVPPPEQSLFAATLRAVATGAFVAGVMTVSATNWTAPTTIRPPAGADHRPGIHTACEDGVADAILDTNPDLALLVRDAEAAARDAFGQYLRGVTLRGFEDPEEGTRRLCICIRTNMTPTQFAVAADRFDEDWWIDAMPKARSRVIITHEFV